MSSKPVGRGQRIADLDRQVQTLQSQSERSRSALDALYNISLACRGSTSFRHIFDAVARELQHVFPFDAFYIAVCDTQRADMFRAVLLVDEGVAEYHEFIPFGPLTGRMINERAPQLFHDLAGERATFEQAPDPFGNEQKLSRSWLGVPLLVGSNAVGVISLQSYQPNVYANVDLDLLQQLGNVVAVVLENAWLDQQQQSLGDALAEQVAARTSELRALSSVAAELVLQRPLRELLERALSQIVPLFDMQAATVRVLDSRFGHLTLAAQCGFSTDYERDAETIPIEGSAVGMIVRDNSSLVIESGLRSSALPSLLRYIPYEAMIGVPLRIGERVLGALSMFGYEARPVSQQTVDLAQAIGNQMAIAVENARLFESQERQIRDLDAIGRIGQSISASFDFEEMLSSVYQTLHELVRPSVFYLLICEPISHVVTNAIFIENGERVALDWLGQPPARESITAWIMNQREPLLFQDLTQQRDALLARGIRPRSVGPENPVRSWVGVPLLAKDSETIGVLSLQDYQSHSYDDQTIDFLTQVASHISLGVQKVRLFEDRERQIVENERLFAAEQDARRTADTLREVARVLSTSFDPREVLELMLRELHNVIAYDTASIMLLEQDMLRIAASRGLPDHARREMLLPRQQSGAGLVVRQRQPHLIHDVTHSPDWMELRSPVDTRSWLGVPLIAKGVVLGVLNIDSRQPGYFNARDVEVAQAFANQAAVALENARLYEESVTRVEQELEIARHIQSNLFPHALPQLAGLELSARCIPARETGGDFFDFVTLDESLNLGEDSRKLALFVGDASGKSIPGAMLMAIAHSIVRSEARDHQEPREVMREANGWITNDVPSRSFVALCYATLDLEGRRLALANAGQLTPIRRRGDGQIEYLEAPGPRLPLGILPDTPYESCDVALEAGDLLVFFTDGIVEAKNRQQELFGFERVEALLAEHGDAPTSALIDHVLAAIDDFCEGTPPHDDMTIVALRIS